MDGRRGQRCFRARATSTLKDLILPHEREPRVAVLVSKKVSAGSRGRIGTKLLESDDLMRWDDGGAHIQTQLSEGQRQPAHELQGLVGDIKALDLGLHKGHLLFGGWPDRRRLSRRCQPSDGTMPGREGRATQG